jgi:hypothetical protein
MIGIEGVGLSRLALSWKDRRKIEQDAARTMLRQTRDSHTTSLARGTPPVAVLELLGGFFDDTNICLVSV